MQNKILLIVLLLLPLSVWAESGNLAITTTPHFMPLVPATKGKALEGGGQSKKFYSLRSDRVNMLDGRMRSDRQKIVVYEKGRDTREGIVKADPEQRNDGASATTLDAGDPVDEGEAIVGINETIDPVLALFGDDDGGAPTSFHEAMLAGREGKGRLMRHGVWPIPRDVKQYVSSLYGMRKDPIHGRRAFHGGMDIVAAVGTDIFATADGEVIDAKTDVNYGNYVTLRHADGMLTRYGHLGAYKVKEGQRVKAGQVIGALGNTGRSTGPHLDYRVSKDGVKYDPLLVLTVPADVSVGGTAVNVTIRKPENRGARAVASNALSRGPLVIKVR